MAIREAVIRLSANATGFQTGITRAASVGKQFYNDMQSGERQLAVAQRRTQQELTNLTNQFGSVKAAASGITGVIAGAFATSQLIHYADTWTLLGSRIGLASESSSAAAQNLSTLMEISQRTGTSFEANAQLFARVSKGMKQIGYDAQATAKLTELMATSLRLSGASTEEASSVTVQFSQAIAAGVLRGEEFNAIMENGSRFATALADGLGVTVGQLRNMANTGQLTTDRIMPALLGQFQKVREEGEKLGATVSASMQRVQNAFLQYVGTANESVGVTTILASTLNGLAANIDTVANTAGILIGLGLARYFGGLTTSALGSVGALAKATLTERELAAAQLATANTAAAAARQTAARAAMSRLAATSLEAQLTAEIALRAAQRDVVATAGTAAAAGERLAGSAGLISRLGSGILGLLGGWPGLIIAAGAATFTLYQNMEQTHKAAVAYADQLQVINDKLKTMSSTQAAATAIDLRGSLNAQKEDLSALDEQLRQVRDSIKAMQNLQKDYDDSPTIAAINNLMSREALERKLGQAVDAETKLEAQREGVVAKMTATQNTMNAAHDAAYTKALDQASAIKTLAGAYQILDRVTGKAAADQAKQNFPGVVVSTSALKPEQQKAYQKALDDLTNSRLSGLDKEHAKNEQAARDLGLVGAQYTKYIAILDEAARNDKNAADAKKAHTKELSDQAKATREAAKLEDNYNTKMREVANAIEVANVRLKQGKDAADLYATTQAGNVKWSKEEIAAYRSKRTELEKISQAYEKNEEKIRLQIEASKDLAKQARQTAADLAVQANSNTPMNAGQRDLYANQMQAQTTYNQSRRTPEDMENLNKTLDNLNAKYQLMNEQRQDWMKGVQQGWADWSYEATNYASQAAEGVSTVMDGALNGITEMLNGNKAGWKDWGISVLKIIETIALKMAITGLISSVASSFASAGAGAAAGGGGSANNSFSGGAYSNLTLNANGGVYNSPNLSQYSGQIVSSPTLFAFANGGGLMGEAGPEAIMPLARDSSGKLGVRSAGNSGGGVVVNSTVNVNGNSATSQQSGSADAVGRAYQQVIDDSVTNGIRNGLKQGGIIWKAMNGR